jgi:hypothetical protein
MIIARIGNVTFEVLQDGVDFVREPNTQAGFKEVASPRMIVDLGRYSVDGLDREELSRRVEAVQRIMEQGL